MPEPEDQWHLRQKKRGPDTIQDVSLLSIIKLLCPFSLSMTQFQVNDLFLGANEHSGRRLLPLCAPDATDTVQPHPSL